MNESEEPKKEDWASLAVQVELMDSLERESTINGYPCRIVVVRLDGKGYFLNIGTTTFPDRFSLDTTQLKIMNGPVPPKGIYEFEHVHEGVYNQVKRKGD